MLPRSLRPSAIAVVAIALGAGSSFLALPVRADDKADLAKGKQLFQDALQLETSGNYSAALPKFQAVIAIKKTPQVEFHIARCQEKIGRLTEALGGYRLASSDAAPGSATDKRLEEVIRESDASAAALEKRIPTLTVKRGSGAAVASATLDGTAVGASQLGKPQQVNPGPHTVEATASGKLPFKQVVDVAESETKTVELVLKDASPVAATSASAAPSASDTPPEGPPPDSKKATWVPYAVGGVGLATLAASGIFFALRGSAKSDLSGACHGSICPNSELSTGNRGKTMTTLGNVTLVAGSILLVGGVTIFAVQHSGGSSAPPSNGTSSTPPLFTASAIALPGTMGANLVGQF